MRLFLVLAVTLACTLAAPAARGQGDTKPGAEPPAKTTGGAPASGAADKGDGDLRAKTQNPVGSLISVPLQNTFDFGANNGNAYILTVQPVIPFTVGEINFINRIIAPIADAPGGVVTPSNPNPVGSGRVFGLGDINYSLFLSPAKPGKVIWGVGPSITFPTATDSRLGSEKWSAGPTVVLLTQPKPWTLGILLRQLWSFAGASDRADVNQLLIQPFINYNLVNGWYLYTDPVLTANWDASPSQRWTIPLGGGVGRVFSIGTQPVNLRLGAFYNVERPDSAPKWFIQFTFQLLFPK